ncbi:hypothetical protein [Haloarcula marina]|uniref:hypothetical protein n=1 Tax=Haloarcula marina TaxID=2961574 RepID=UPI0020B6AE5C|nr:hypothetical protein [Halomicroarcula marina]
MATNSRVTVSSVDADAHPLHSTDDRYCKHCHEIALAFDPGAERPRCRTCGELA